MKWIFEDNGCGRERGFHDAGVETFKGDFYRYLARELLQNSLDARLDENKPVRVKFEVLELLKTDIPDFVSLSATFSRCAEFWKEDTKAVAFFEAARSLARKKKIRVLRIKDFNTTGVAGGDGDRHSGWHSLVRSTGSSSKGGGEGGSFGIGKNAPFAASELRTVLYSTYNEEDEHIFQGVSTLVSHKHPDGYTAQETGYLGGANGASVRDKKDIPKIFIRKEYGLDVIILGFPESVEWQGDLVYSVLDSFWPAIDFGDLEVTVGTEKINRRNLAGLLEKYSTQPKFTAHLFYNSFKKPTKSFTEKLRLLKDVTLYLAAGEVLLPKKVAMVRKTGMVIFPKRFRSPMSYCGVFICRNDDGNRLLREMEPPRHDTWDANHPDIGANRKTKQEYEDFIRDCIGRLVNVDDSKVISIPDLNRFLPDDDESTEAAFGDEDEESTVETPHRSPLPERITGRKMEAKPPPMQPDSSKLGDGFDETENGTGEGTGGAPGENVNTTDGGKGSGGGGKDEGSASPASGGPGGVQSKPAVPIRYRTFASNPAAGVYIVAVSAHERFDGNVNLIILAVGDDQKAKADINEARLSSGADIGIIDVGVLGPIRLQKNKTTRIEIVLREPVRIAMEVSAHEA